MKRYHSFSDHLRERFGEKVHKISLDVRFTCPNRNGEKGTGGCTYCLDGSTSVRDEERGLPVAVQIGRARERLTRRFGAKKFLAYFQAYSNTYADPHILRNLYDEALDQKDVVGLSVGTRPDCVPDETLELLKEYHRRTYLWVELGLQSIHDRTLLRINRGHTVAEFRDCLDRLAGAGIRVCAHVIFGLPGESEPDFRATMEAVAGLPISGIKIHHLHVLRGTEIERQYARGEIPLLSRDRYLGLVCDFIEMLPPTVVVQRVMGEASPEELVAPDWTAGKGLFLSALEKEFERRGTRQGDRRNRVSTGSPAFS